MSSDASRGYGDCSGVHKVFRTGNYEVMFTNDINSSDLPGPAPVPVGLPETDAPQPTTESTTSNTAQSSLDSSAEDTQQRAQPPEQIQLDPHQKSISRQDIDRPLLIVAGAGSGKTSTLCARVIEMIKQGVPPENIMVISFTKKAARELGERISKYMAVEGMDSKSLPHSSTFHSWCFTLIRNHYSELGLAGIPDVVSSEDDVRIVVELAYMLIENCKQLTLCEEMLEMPFPADDDPDSAGTLMQKDRLKRWDAVRTLAADRLDWQGVPGDPEPEPEGGAAQRYVGSLADTRLRREFAANSDLWSFLRSHLDKEHRLLNIPTYSLLGPLPMPGTMRYMAAEKRYKEKVDFIQSTKSRGYLATEYGLDERSAIEAFNEILRMHNLVDFEDMLSLANTALKNPRILRLTRDRYKYLLVDEFQDLNSQQMRLILQLQKDIGRVTAVGDERQSIYGFRGATCESNFKIFLEHFVDTNVARMNGIPDSLVGTMESLAINYRSHRGIVDLGNVVVSDSQVDGEGLLARLRVPLQPLPDKPMLPVVVSGCKTAASEGRAIAKKIQSLIGSETCRPRDIAVLFRGLKFGKYRPSMRLEKELLQRKIPFVIRGGASMIGGDHVQKYMSLLKVMVDRKDDMAMRICIIHFVANIGPVYLERIDGMAPVAGGNNSLFGKAERVLNTREIPVNARRNLGQFLETVKGWRSEMGSMTLKELVTKVFYSFAVDDLAKLLAGTTISDTADTGTSRYTSKMDVDKFGVNVSVLLDMVAIFFLARRQGTIVEQKRFAHSDMCSPEMLRAFLAHV
ncbi:hypothetical protein FBU59_000851, partial [Linderina macrospora]